MLVLVREVTTRYISIFAKHSDFFFRVCQFFSKIKIDLYISTCIFIILSYSVLALIYAQNILFIRADFNRIITFIDWDFQWVRGEVGVHLQYEILRKTPHL